MLKIDIETPICVHKLTRHCKLQNMSYHEIVIKTYLNFGRFKGEITDIFSLK